MAKSAALIREARVVRAVMSFLGPREAALGLAQTCKSCAVAEASREAYWHEALRHEFLTPEEAEAEAAEAAPAGRVLVRATTQTDDTGDPVPTGTRTRYLSHFGAYRVVMGMPECEAWSRAQRQDEWRRLVGGGPADRSAALNRALRLAQAQAAIELKAARAGSRLRARTAPHILLARLSDAARSIAATDAKDGGRSGGMVSAEREVEGPDVWVADNVVRNVLQGGVPFSALHSNLDVTEGGVLGLFKAAPPALCGVAGGAPAGGTAALPGTAGQCEGGWGPVPPAATWMLGTCLVVNVLSAVALLVDRLRQRYGSENVPLEFRVSNCVSDFVCVCWRRRRLASTPWLAAQLLLVLWHGVAAVSEIVEHRIARAGAPGAEASAAAAALALAGLAVACMGLDGVLVADCMVRGCVCARRRGAPVTAEALLDDGRAKPGGKAADASVRHARLAPLTAGAVSATCVAAGAMTLLQALALWLLGTWADAQRDPAVGLSASGLAWVGPPWRVLAASRVAVISSLGLRTVASLSLIASSLRHQPDGDGIPWPFTKKSMALAGVMGLVTAASLVQAGCAAASLAGVHVYEVVAGLSHLVGGAALQLTWMTALLLPFAVGDKRKVRTLPRPQPLQLGTGSTTLRGMLTPSVLAVVTIGMRMEAAVRRWRDRRRASWLVD